MLAVLLALGLGIGLGAAATAYAVRLDAVGAVNAGAWRIEADAGTPAINPYLRARFARSGEIPFAQAQGVTALATVDDAGRPLDRGCVYQVTGPVPPALFWTLAAVDHDGAPFNNPAYRLSFTTDEIVRDADGAFAIAVSATVEPGNWLPVTGIGPFTLVLRLYDTRPADPAGAGPAAAAMPRIERVRCV